MGKYKRFKSRFLGGYSKKRVEAFIEQSQAENAKEAEARRARIVELRDANRSLTEQLDEYKRKERYAAEVVRLAHEEAERIAYEAKVKLEAELQELRQEADRWRRLLASYHGRVETLRKVSADAMEQCMANLFYDAQRAGVAPTREEIDRAQTAELTDQQDEEWNRYLAQEDGDDVELEPESLSPVEQELADACRELIPETQEQPEQA